MGFFGTIRAGCSYLKACIWKKPEDSLENFYINRFGRVLYSMFFEGYTEKLWGRPPGEISADWGAQRVKGLSVTAVLKDMLAKWKPARGERKKHANGQGEKQNRKQGGREIETSLIEEFYYPKYGPGQLWEIVAEEIKALGGVIMKHTQAVRFEGDNGKLTRVICRTPSGERAETCDILISSMPIKDLVQGMADGGMDVPGEMYRISQGLPYRDFVTVGVLVKKLSLKNRTRIKTINDQVPDCWIYVQDTGVKMGRIQIFNNWSPYLVKDVEHSVWIGLEYFCNENDSFWNMPKKECIRFAVRELRRMGIIESGKDVLDAHREKVKKAYPAYFDTYYEMGKLVPWLDGFENLYCIGRNGQHRYNNMDHSMVTAFEAVDNILSGKREKDNIWDVNTEQEYHESRAPQKGCPAGEK